MGIRLDTARRSTVIGLAAGGLIVLVMLLLAPSQIGLFVNVPGLLIVVGGTFAATLVSRPFADVVRVLRSLPDLARDEPLSVDQEIGQIQRVAEYYPQAAAGTGLILGNFNQIPIISLDVNPEVDYKYYLDMQLHLIATSPQLKGLGMTGYWGSYYDDEELDRFRGRESHCYTPQEVEEFEEILTTMRDDEVAGWVRSLQLRGVALPDDLKDQVLLIVGERRGS